MAQHDGEWPQGLRWHADGVHVSDDGWWKDFPDAVPGLTRRLLSTDVEVKRMFPNLAGSNGDWTVIETSKTGMTEEDYDYLAPMNIGAGSGYMRVCAHVPLTAVKKASVEMEGPQLLP